MIYGAIVAWIALLIIAKVPVPGLGTVWPAIVVGVTVLLGIVASTDLLSYVPANVYGYAALGGYTLSADKLDRLTAADKSNPLFLIVVSAILGAVLGYLMGQLSGALKPRLARTDIYGSNQYLEPYGRHGQSAACSRACRVNSCPRRTSGSAPALAQNLRLHGQALPLQGASGNATAISGPMRFARCAIRIGAALAPC